MCSLIPGKHLNKDSAFFNQSALFPQVKLAEMKPRTRLVLFVISETALGSAGDVTSRPVPHGVEPG